jgi:hypothetical protein
MVIDIPKIFPVDQTDERLLVRVRDDYAFLSIAAIPASEGVSDLIAAEEWVPKKGAQLLREIGVEEAQSSAGPRGRLIAGHFCRSMSFRHAKLNILEIWAFTPDGKRYFYAYYQDSVAGSGNYNSALATSRFSSSWYSDAVRAIRAVK